MPEPESQGFAGERLVSFVASSQWEYLSASSQWEYLPASSQWEYLSASSRHEARRSLLNFLGCALDAMPRLAPLAALMGQR